MTTARTYVLVPKSESDKAYVYFGGNFAYECGVNDAFRKDLAKENMASIREKGKYNV